MCTMVDIKSWQKVTTYYRNYNIVSTIYKLHVYILISQVQYKEILAQFQKQDSQVF